MKISFQTEVTGENIQNVDGIYLKKKRRVALFPNNLKMCCKIAKQFKYDGIEIAMSNPDHINLSELTKLLELNNLNLSAIATGNAARIDGLSFSSSCEDVRKKAVNRMFKFIDFASHFNAIVLVGALKGKIENDKEFIEAKNRITECLIECDSYAKKRDVYIALEPVNRYEDDFLNTIIECKQYLEEINLKNVMMMIDTYHMNIEDSNMWESIRKSRELIIHVHYSDSNRLAPGMGHFDFNKMTKLLKEIGYSGYLSAEISPIPDDYTAVKLSIKNITNYLSE